ncbi:DUF1217 domain-containing protein [Sulfitobacter sp. M57]|uniref:DUF1217 domain-containing protein n=1 Tax=unclassified Sulfitobacter TaxID=196795 RepID=UPI0023E18C51|nr:MULTISPECIES: DUF1217 domain-containing protein [unclassified Sulfitobacter]MDF3414837.1 DUF1217 domain-containing protein [Sulfitobacter sp. KE5]MDF3422318.1 DUF1217 domain-containing protein [Sulfitobacter sp. KE43]MDF3433383.1 DUF1217 domain-containing protein [Sulfitobacter sp. KE42]MDF3459023.1 DUF1217 domain-containing protein [Sulfitobacter sp. S74]MDF3462922.1 DUF1217 domain-containing protein [Sulfitobacter sp. Ks18]
MIGISGIGSQAALRLIDATRDQQLESMRNEAANKRSEAAFRERIGSITTPKELVADFEVYSFVMKAFDLEDQIFGKGMIRKVLESDPVEPSSLLNRLTDTRFRELHLALGFTTESGPQVPDFTNPAFLDEISDRFYNRQFINTNDEQNSTVGTVLEFRETGGDISSWFEVLGNKKLTNFFQVALGLPTQMSGLDVDRQAEMFKEKFDLADLVDPAERERLITRYVAISDVLNPQGFSSESAAVNILQNSRNNGQFVAFTLDIDMVNFSASRLYR